MWLLPLTKFRPFHEERRLYRFITVNSFAQNDSRILKVFVCAHQPIPNIIICVYFIERIFIEDAHAKQVLSTGFSMVKRTDMVPWFLLSESLQCHICICMCIILYLPGKLFFPLQFGNLFLGYGNQGVCKRFLKLLCPTIKDHTDLGQTGLELNFNPTIYKRLDKPILFSEPQLLL